LSALLLCTPLAAAPAQEAPPPPAEAEGEAAEEPLWEGTLGLAYLATSGNADTQTVGFDLAAERQPRPWGLATSASFHRVQRDGEVTAERYVAKARAKRSLAERWNLFGGLSADKDEFADVDLRLVTEVGGTWKALTGPRHELALDAALTWTDEDRVAPEADSNYLGALLGLTYAWQLSETAELGQEILYYPNFDVTGDWRAESVTALSAAVLQRLAVKLSYEVRYRHQPLDDKEDTDTTTKVSLVWNL
jgi:putative salt-induced outer membrane protein YdiY